MTLRIAARADSQLDGRGTTSLADQLAVLAFIARDAEARGVSLMLDGGDYYEHKRTTPEERRAGDEADVEQASRCWLGKVLGNHDDEEDFLAANRLATEYPLLAFATPGVHALAGAAVAFLPWPSVGSLRAWLNRPASIEETDTLAREMLRDVLRGFAVEFAKLPADTPRVLLMHGTIDGSKLSTGQPLIGASLTLGLEDLALADADVVIAGHIHLPQDFQITRPDGTVVPVIVPGSTRRRDFGEVEAKRYVVLEFDGRRIVSREDVPLPVPPMFHVDARWETNGVVIPGREFLVSNDAAWPEEVAGALLRLRYTVGAEHQEAARRAAEQAADVWRAAGAALVKIEPVVAATVCARVPGIAAATTIAEKCRVKWALEQVPDAEQAALLPMLAELEAKVPPVPCASAGLKVLRAQIRGVGKIRSADVDFTAFGERALVAIVGPNGAGKSTFCQAIAGACTARRSFFSACKGGTLVSAAKGRDAFVKVEIETPRRLTIEQLLDGTGKKGESAVRDANGARLLDSASVDAFDEWAKSNLMPRSILAATAWAVQGDKGILGMTEAARKGLVLETLGISRYEQLAKAARDAATATRSSVDRLSVQLVEAKRTAVPVPIAEEGVTNAQASASLRDADVAAARTALAEARARHAALVEAHANAEAARAAHAAAREDLHAAGAARGALLVRAEGQRKLLADADRVKAAVASLSELETALAGDEAALAAATTRLTESRAAAKEATARRDAATSKLAAATRRETEARGAVEPLTRARNKASLLPGLVEEMERRKAAVDAAEAAVEELRGATLDVAGKRIDNLRAGHVEIVATGDTTRAPGISQHALANDAEISEAATDAPGKLTAARSTLAAARAAETLSREALTEAEKIVARIPDLERASAQATEAAAEAQAARIEQEAAAGDVLHAETLTTQRVGEVAAAQRDRDASRSKTAAARELAARSPAIAAAEAALAEIEGQLPAATKAVADAQAALDRTPAPPADVPLPPDLTAQERAVVDAEARVQAARNAVAVAVRGVEDAKTAAARIEDMETARLSRDVELARWNRLAADLGLDGLQALEISAAGPELTAITNDLLHGAFSHRYSVEFQTTKPYAGSDELRECYDVNVLDQGTDTEAGYSGTAEGLSDGQKVPVGTAIRLALLLIANRRSGIAKPQIWLDEAGAALDSEGASAAYVSMLRRAAAMLDAGQMFVVTHDQAVAAACDRRIRVAGGSVAVS